MEGIPTELRAGDTWSWTESGGDYPASLGWSLTYSLLPVGGVGTKITIGAAASGADYAVSVAATTTANFAPGAYSWVGRVAKSSEVHTVANGSITVLPDLAAATTYDSRSTATKALAKIDAWLAGDKSIEVASYTIGDRQIQHHDLDKLIVLRDALKAEVAGERAAAALAAGGADPRNMRIRFGVG